MIINNTNRPVIFFDGECNLCNGTIQFIIREDRKKIFLFATLQSDGGAVVTEELKNSQHGAPDSVVLLYNGRYYVKSNAALHILRLLGGFWRLLYVLMIIPRFLRNAVYDFISRNRYRWFGKRDTCMLPTPELRERFL